MNPSVVRVNAWVVWVKRSHENRQNIFFDVWSFRLMRSNCTLLPIPFSNASVRCRMSCQTCRRCRKRQRFSHSHSSDMCASVVSCERRVLRTHPRRFSSGRLKFHVRFSGKIKYLQTSCAALFSFVCHGWPSGRIFRFNANSWFQNIPTEIETFVRRSFENRLRKHFLCCLKL